LSNGVPNMKQRETYKAADVFAAELATLPAELRAFVETSIDGLSPSYFWHVPASLGGGNHPWVSRSLGGLVKHTRLAAWWAVRLSARSNATDTSAVRAEAVAACLLHDLCKFARPSETYDDGPYVKHHGHWAGLALCDLWKRDWMAVLGVGALGRIDVACIPFDTFARIALAVYWHMGRWSPRPP